MGVASSANQEIFVTGEETADYDDNTNNIMTVQSSQQLLAGKEEAQVKDSMDSVIEDVVVASSSSYQDNNAMNNQSDEGDQKMTNKKKKKRKRNLTGWPKIKATSASSSKKFINKTSNEENDLLPPKEVVVKKRGRRTKSSLDQNEVKKKKTLRRRREEKEKEAKDKDNHDDNLNLKKKRRINGKEHEKQPPIMVVEEDEENVVKKRKRSSSLKKNLLFTENNLESNEQDKSMSVKTDLEEQAQPNPSCIAINPIPSKEAPLFSRFSNNSSACNSSFERKVVNTMMTSSLLSNKNLKAGLLSQDFKKSDDQSEETRTPVKKRLLLPLPDLFLTKHLFNNRLDDFELPFDIAFNFFAKEDDASSSSSPANNVANNVSVNNNQSQLSIFRPYKQVISNTFEDKDSTPDSGIIAHACECTRLESCRPGLCVNHAMQVECDPENCPIKDQCNNQRMQKSLWTPGLLRFWTGSQRGWGVKTSIGISEGDFILEYIGHVVPLALFRARMSNEYSQDDHHFCLHLTKNLVIDGYRVSNEGRFVNHSCDPNCVAQKWSVSGKLRVGIFAKRDILPGEELTYDYNFDNFNLHSSQRCFCGAKTCRGFIGLAKDNKKKTKTKDKVTQVKKKRQKKKKKTIVSSTELKKNRKALKEQQNNLLLSTVEQQLSKERETTTNEGVVASSAVKSSDSIDDVIDSVVEGNYCFAAKSSHDHVVHDSVTTTEAVVQINGVSHESTAKEKEEDSINPKRIEDQPSCSKEKEQQRKQEPEAVMITEKGQKKPKTEEEEVKMTKTTIQELKSCSSEEKSDERAPKEL